MHRDALQPLDLEPIRVHRDAFVCVLMLGVIFAARSFALGCTPSPELAVAHAMVLAGVIGAAAVAGREALWAALSRTPTRASLAAAAMTALGTFAFARASASGAMEASTPVDGVAIFFAVLVPATIEELAFRGLVHHTLTRWCSPPGAIIAGSALFAAAHQSPAQMPQLFLGGLALAFLRVRTASLYPAMLAHALHNALCLFVR